MKKAFAIVLLLLVSVLAAGHWLFGRQAQLIQEDVLDTALFEGRIEQGKQSFSRGLFSTDVAGEVTANNGDIKFNWQQTTQHGPLPWVQLAQGNTELIPVQAVFALDILFAIESAVGAIKSREPVKLTTTIGLMGDLVGSLQYVGLQQSLTEDRQFVIGPVDGRYRLHQADNILSYQVNSASAMFSDAWQSIDLSKPSIQCDLGLSGPTALPLGNCALNLSTLALREKTQPLAALNMNNGQARLFAERAGDWINSRIVLDADTLTIGTHRLSSVNLKSNIDGLAESALQAFQTSVQQQGLPSTGEDWRPLLIKLFNEGEPQLGLTATANREEEKLSLSAGLEVSPGLLGTGSTFSLLAAIETWVKLDIHQELLHDLLAIRSDTTQGGIEPVTDKPPAQVARWVEQGILVARGDRWLLDMAYYLGVISLNGKTINPVEFMRQ